jgi:hypothetical protein
MLSWRARRGVRRPCRHRSLGRARQVTRLATAIPGAQEYGGSRASVGPHFPRWPCLGEWPHIRFRGPAESPDFAKRGHYQRPEPDTRGVSDRRRSGSEKQTAHHSNPGYSSTFDINRRFAAGRWPSGRWLDLQAKQQTLEVFIGRITVLLSTQDTQECIVPKHAVDDVDDISEKVK